MIGMTYRDGDNFTGIGSRWGCNFIPMSILSSYEMKNVFNCSLKLCIFA